MRVLLLNQTFHPDLVATAQHMTDLARYLSERGHQFEAIASRSAYQQHDSLLPAYEELGDIHIHRVGRSFFGKGTVFQRLIDFTYYYVAALFKSLRVGRPDVVLCLTTPPFIVTVGWLLRLLRGCRLVYYVMDLYPDVPVACGVMRPGSLLTGLLERVNRLCLRRADRTIVPGRCMRDRVRGKIGPAEHLRLVTPWASREEITPLPAAENSLRTEQGWADDFVVAYCGNLGLGHELQTILAAIDAMADDEQVRFAFVGGGARFEQVKRQVAGRRRTKVSILPYQPRERLGRTLAAADVPLLAGFVTPIHPDPSDQPAGGSRGADRAQQAVRDHGGGSARGVRRPDRVGGGPHVGRAGVWVRRAGGRRGGAGGAAEAAASGSGPGRGDGPTGPPGVREALRARRLLWAAGGNPSRGGPARNGPAQERQAGGVRGGPVAHSAPGK